MEKKEMPYALLPAVVHLDEVQIKCAIDAAVSAYGYVVSKVTIECHPDQRNGPDAFSAKVEEAGHARDCRGDLVSRLLLAASVAGSEQRAALLREAAGALAGINRKEGA